VAFYTAGHPSTQHAGYISQVYKRGRYGRHPDRHDVSMPHKKSKTKSDDATRASLRQRLRNYKTPERLLRLLVNRRIWMKFGEGKDTEET